MSVTLNEDQQQKIHEHLLHFQEYMKYEGFDHFQRHRLEHVEFFQNEFPRRLNELSEPDITEMISKLWASQIWGSKQYHAQSIIYDNGLDKLQQEFQRLLDQDQSPGERYEHFVKGIKRLGPASVTEILCYNEPERCGIWNRRAREAFENLGLDDVVDPEKYQLNGAEYENFNTVLEAIAEEIRSYGIEDVDLLLVDYFLYEVAKTAESGDRKADPVMDEFDHNEIRDMIESIGEMLGFESQTELRIAPGSQVDAVWRARIGNLGVVTYVFEVHKSGAIDSLLMNLYKARSNPTVQKIIAVSDETQLSQIKNEASALPEEFRRTLVLWPVEQVQEVADKLQRVSEIIDHLGLVRGEFPVS